jgi:hypothetical protein
MKFQLYILQIYRYTTRIYSQYSFVALTSGYLLIMCMVLIEDRDSV